MDAEYFFPFFHVVFSEAATVQPEYKKQRYAANAGFAQTDLLNIR
jgi:hypothetical protein